MCVCKQIISLIAHEHKASQPTLSQLRLYKYENLLQIVISVLRGGNAEWKLTTGTQTTQDDSILGFA